MRAPVDTPPCEQGAHRAQHFGAGPTQHQHAAAPPMPRRRDAAAAAPPRRRDDVAATTTTPRRRRSRRRAAWRRARYARYALVLATATAQCKHGDGNPLDTVYYTGRNYLDLRNSTIEKGLWPERRGGRAEISPACPDFKTYLKRRAHQHSNAATSSRNGARTVDAAGTRSPTTTTRR